jgi:hypothetical protein
MEEQEENLLELFSSPRPDVKVELCRERSQLCPNLEARDEL